MQEKKLWGEGKGGKGERDGRKRGRENEKTKKKKGKTGKDGVRAVLRDEKGRRRQFKKQRQMKMDGREKTEQDGGGNERNTRVRESRSDEGGRRNQRLIGREKDREREAKKG